MFSRKRTLAYFTDKEDLKRDYDISNLDFPPYTTKFYEDTITKFEGLESARKEAMKMCPKDANALLEVEIIGRPQYAVTVQPMRVRRIRI